MPKICVFFLFLGVSGKMIFFGDSLGDSENNLKVHVFLSAVESAVAADVGVDAAQEST